VLLGCSATPAPPSAVTPPAATFRRVPLGLCEDYPEESRSLAQAREDFELMRRLGIDTLRVSIGWDAVEPERDRYDFEFWDAFVDLAVRRYGLRLIPYVAYTPAWNADGPEAERWKAPPREPAEFAELMTLLATRHHGLIHSWELWNEPDNRDYWLGSTEQYAELARLGAEAVHGVDPELSVVSGGLAGRIEFLRELFDRFGAASYIDVVNLHAYFETWNPAPTETLGEYVEEAQNIVRRHGGRQAIWMAEIGYANYREGRHVSAYTSARFAHEHTLEYQAVVLVRSMALLLASPAVSLVAWYELKDPPLTDAMIGDINNRHLGVAFADRAPKPAAAALGFITRVFDPGFRNIDDRVRVAPEPAGAGAVVHAFLTARHTLVVIAWLTTPSAPEVPDAGGDARDDRRATLRLDAPFRAVGPLIYHDALGRERGRTPLDRGVDVGISLELAGGDVVVAEVPVADAP
jgi:hypothetical protein